MGHAFLTMHQPPLRPQLSVLSNLSLFRSLCLPSLSQPLCLLSFCLPSFSVLVLQLFSPHLYIYLSFYLPIYLYISLLSIYLITVAWRLLNGKKKDWHYPVDPYLCKVDVYVLRDMDLVHIIKKEVNDMQPKSLTLPSHWPIYLSSPFLSFFLPLTPTSSSPLSYAYPHYLFLTLPLLSANYPFLLSLRI